MNSLSYLGSPRFLFVFWHETQERIFLKGTFSLEVKWSVYMPWGRLTLFSSLWQTIKSGLKPPRYRGDILLLPTKAGCTHASAHTQHTCYICAPLHTHILHKHTSPTYTTHTPSIYTHTPPTDTSHTHTQSPFSHLLQKSPTHKMLDTSHLF